MRSFRVYTSESSARADKRIPPRSESSLLARLRRGKLRLAGFLGLLLAVAYACLVVLRLLRLPPHPDPGASSLGFMLAMAPGAARLGLGLALTLYAASAAMLIALAYRGGRLLPRLFMTAAAIAMEPLYSDLRAFDFHWLALFGLALSFLLHRQGWRYTAGLPLAAAILLQPAVLAVPAYFLWKRQYPYALSALGTAAICGMLAALFHGIGVFPLGFGGWREALSSYMALWPAAGLDGAAARLAAILDLTVLALMVCLLPSLRSSTQHRFDYSVAAASVVWLSPVSAGTGGMIFAIACYLLLGGIAAERYTESSAPLRFAAPEQWALLCCGLSYLIPFFAREAPLGGWLPVLPNALLALLAAKLLFVPVCVLAWKLHRLRTRRTVRLSDYRLRRDGVGR